MRVRGDSVFCLGAAWLLVSVSAGAQYDPESVWPLCGRISEHPPVGWSALDGCPADRFGNAAFADVPLSATFGPRPLASEGDRYDFHRGLDIATPTGTPFFAIADGTVRIAGHHPSYTDPLVQVRHYRPGETGCSTAGCYHSLYMHASGWVVYKGQQVTKGQLPGYTGASASGFEHLHFELRDAPAFDPYSSWSREAVHPLRALPYTAANDTVITFNRVDGIDSGTVRVDVTVVSDRFDLAAVVAAVLDAGGIPVAQPGSAPDAKGYHVLPPFFDMEEVNFAYSHKDSIAFPWESFGAGGANECPHHADHGPAYDAQVHLDAQHPDDEHDGLFNGVHVRTRKYWPGDVHDYRIELGFLALRGPAACLVATAVFASGHRHTARWGDCGSPPSRPPNARLSWTCTGPSCTFDGSDSVDEDGTIVAFDWTFGGGEGSSGARVSHAYSTAGEWLVTLTVTDDAGATGEAVQKVSVADLPGRIWRVRPRGPRSGPPLISP